MNEKQRLLDLRTELLQHCHNYYNLNRPTISDSEYDRLFLELQKLETKYPDMADPNSPTAKVGSVSLNHFTKVKHTVPMMSLENSFEAGEAVHRLLSSSSFAEVIMEPKIDGLACSLKYSGGKLVQAVTRGDHEIGDDVTANVRTVKDIPLVVDCKRDFEVRGEVYLSKVDFAKLNDKLKELGEEPFVNARNAAAGSLKQKDSSICAQRSLRFIAYQIVGEATEPGRIVSQLEMLTFLKSLRFSLAWPTMEEFSVFILVSDQGASAKFLQKILDHFNGVRKTLPYDTDGAVLKLNSLELQASLGNKTRAPRWATAFKFPAERATTTVNDIQWQVGRTGKLTPVAILAPVVCGGVTVKRATLNNPDYIALLKVGIGSTVEIERGGEVIPTVLSVVKNPLIHPNPVVCPCCNKEVAKHGANLFCMNSECQDQVVQRLQHAVGKSCLDWNGFGSETVQWFVEQAKVTNFSQLFALTDSWVNTHVSGAVGKTFLAERERVKTAPLWRKIAALGIEGVGQTSSKKLCLQYHSLEEILDAGPEKLKALLGPVATKSFTDYLRDNLKELEACEVYGYMFSEAAPATSSPKPLDGKTFCITGGLMSGTRPQVTTTIESFGGTMKSVSKKLDYLVVGTGGGAKEDNAKKMGIKCISEEDLYAMIGIPMPVISGSEVNQYD